MARQDSARTTASDGAGGIAQRLADGLARRGNRGRAAEGLRELGAMDRAVYSAVAATPTPSLDEPLRRVSNAANNSGLWLVTAAGLGAAGGGAGRRAAVRGTVAIGVTSALVFSFAGLPHPTRPNTASASSSAPTRPPCKTAGAA
jgi:hypothetical protein